MATEEVLVEEEKVSDRVAVKRALVSVYDKSKLELLAEILKRHSIAVLSTGKTLEVLGKLGVWVESVAAYTGSEEILDGRVKTLHPKLFAGILSRRSKEEHQATMKKQGWAYIDLVVVNLYPFEATIRKAGVTEEEALENIDIGGPSLLRAASKNFESIAAITSPDDYERLGKELQKNEGATTLQFRKVCAQKVFTLTSRYDDLISQYLVGADEGVQERLPENIRLELLKKQELRYGENPHQKGAWYSAGEGCGADSFEILGGKELSYNNLRDLNAAYKLCLEFDEPFAAIFKHTNPCGAASGKSMAEAYRDAYECDPLSAYGGVVGLNQKVDLSTAQVLNDSIFLECILAPTFEPEALELLREKKNRRIVACRNWKSPSNRGWRLFHLEGGFLAESVDTAVSEKQDLQVVSKRKPSEGEIESLLFAEKVAKHTHSNAIVLVQGKKTVGIAGGITSRVDAVWLALHKAGDRAKGSVLASDAFFPMPDGVEKAASGGVSAVLAPSGSKKDAEVTAAADRADISLVFSSRRHFRH
ncbi:MAG TPA: bifunctional phosphoribosylaminoimidazolecarboxamide formyltransferase/IMP cyclohydrolase [candidate division Zixibacteria bacterium]|nr:bifunctional phosphoribosylaminoimidazolecarboxamide formyltransferase/IMP cyclohydrolase [candidate division Zixibacteria bacterium]